MEDNVWGCGGSHTAAVHLRSKLPNFAVQSHSSYVKLLLSMGGLIRKHRTLREATLIGTFNFACFSLFWTVFGFHVNGAPFHYSS
jgi:hypothetical protein